MNLILRAYPTVFNDMTEVGMGCDPAGGYSQPVAITGGMFNIRNQLGT